MPELQDPYDERAIISLIAAGDRPAFRVLHDRYFDHIFSVAKMFLGSEVAADDVIQEVFLHLWQRRESLPEVDNVKGYIFLTTRNTVLNFIRKDSRYQKHVKSFREDEMVSTSDTDSKVITDETRVLIEKGLQRLTPQQRKMLSLSRDAGMTHAEIAEELGVAKKTVANTITTALQELRSFLEENGAPFTLIYALLKELL